MFNFIFILFIIEPIGEWTIHKLLHKLNIWNHLSHHEEVTDNNLKKIQNITLEYWPIFPIVIFYYCNYIILSLCFLKYYVVHSIIHFYPNIMQGLTIHHETHHKYSKYNFCVSTIWPDILFNTQYKKI